MKLSTFTHGGTTRIGVVAGDSMIDLAAAAPELPREMAAFLAAGRPALERAHKAAQDSAHRLDLAKIKIRGAGAASAGIPRDRPELRRPY